MSIPKEARRESYDVVLPTVHQRQAAVFELLKECGSMTAQEVVGELHRRGFTMSSERDSSATHLTELRDAGKAKATNKKMCAKTGRNITVWAVAKENAL